MHPQGQVCHNLACPARGQKNHGHIVVHSKKERRYRCQVCLKTFSATKDTPFYRLQHPKTLFVIVVTLLAFGCPVQAIVKAFGLDERTVTAWQHKAGRHARDVHEHLVQQGQVFTQHVQADELWVKMVGRKVWMAMGMDAASRLWLGGAVSEHRDRLLIREVVRQIARSLKHKGIVVCVDGLSTYVNAFRDGFRQRVKTGQRGGPRLVPEPGLHLGQVIKQYAGRQVTGVVHRVALGTEAHILAVLAATKTGTQLNTAYIERLNATFRSRLSSLVRRGRSLAQQEITLVAGMYLVGGLYNFCSVHDSLPVTVWRDFALVTQQRTPAIAAGLTDHVWTVQEFLEFQLPLPPWVAPKRMGRPPKPRPAITQAVAA